MLTNDLGSDALQSESICFNFQWHRGIFNEADVRFKGKRGFLFGNTMCLSVRED